MSYMHEQHPYLMGDSVDYTWSARFAVEPGLTTDDIVVRKLGTLVAEYADPEWPISGAVLGSASQAERKSVVLGLDPSRTFGTPSVERCEEIAAAVTDTLSWQRLPEQLSEMRIILGRRVGYKGVDHSMETVRNLAALRNCGSVALTEADLFSLRFVGGLRDYQEPSVIIEGQADDLTGVLQVAADMGQERLVAEVTDTVTQVYYHAKEQA